MQYPMLCIHHLKSKLLVETQGVKLGNGGDKTYEQIEVRYVTGPS